MEEIEIYNEQENRFEDEEEPLQNESTTNAKIGDEIKAGILIAISLFSMIGLSCGVKYKKGNKQNKKLCYHV